MVALTAALEEVNSRNYWNRSIQDSWFEKLHRSAEKGRTNRMTYRQADMLRRRALVAEMQRTAVDCAVQIKKPGHPGEEALENQAAYSTVDWSWRTAWTEVLVGAFPKKH